MKARVSKIKMNIQHVCYNLSLFLRKSLIYTTHNNGPFKYHLFTNNHKSQSLRIITNLKLLKLWNVCWTLYCAWHGLLKKFVHKTYHSDCWTTALFQIDLWIFTSFAIKYNLQQLNLMEIVFAFVSKRPKHSSIKKA